MTEVNLHFEDSGGEGRPVILIHGWPLSGESWKTQIPDLMEAGYRVITYDRRGFGSSDKPKTGYDYDTLTADLARLIDELALTDITLVGFSMGGGEVARYVLTHGEDKLHSVVFASSVTPMMLQGPDNPDGPLTKEKADTMTASLTSDSDAFYDKFTKEFFSVNGDGEMLITEEQRQEALAICKQSDPTAALEAMQSFATTDFRNDLTLVTIPTLVMHGDADSIVPFEGSGKRTHAAILHSELHVIANGPHGINVSHVDEFNRTLLAFLEV